MAFTYDVATDRGKVRLLTFDNQPGIGNYVFEDEEIDAFYQLEGESVKRAAALALETLAVNDLFVLKKIVALDLETDGPATAQGFRMMAEGLRRSALEEDARAGALWDIAEWVVDPFTFRERVFDQYLRYGPALA